MKSPGLRIAVGAAAALLGTMLVVYPAALSLGVGFGVIQVPDLDSSWAAPWAIAASLPFWAKLLFSAVGLAALVFLIFFAAARISGAATAREGLAITAIASVLPIYQSRWAWDFGLSPILLLVYVVAGLAGAAFGTRIAGRRIRFGKRNNQFR